MKKWKTHDGAKEGIRLFRRSYLKSSLHIPGLYIHSAFTVISTREKKLPVFPLPGASWTEKVVWSADIDSITCAHCVAFLASDRTVTFVTFVHDEKWQKWQKWQNGHFARKWALKPIYNRVPIEFFILQWALSLAPTIQQKWKELIRRFWNGKQKTKIGPILASKTYTEVTILSLLLLTEMTEVTVL